MAEPFDAAKPLSKRKSPSMSLEQALFEEEQEVLKLIGAKQDNLRPPPPPPIGSRRGGSVSTAPMLGPNGSLNIKGRAGSSTGTRRDLEGLLSPQGYQFGVATNALSRASDLSGNRRRSAPDPHSRRSSSPAPRPIGLKPQTSSPPPTLPSFDKAYRRLSNAAMAQSGGSLGRLASKVLSSPRSSLSQESDFVRLEKDKDPESVIESSSTSDSESESSRQTNYTQSPKQSPTNSGPADELRYVAPQSRVPRSLSAAAEQERRAVASLMPNLTGPGPRPLSALHPPKPRRLGRDPSKPKRVFPSTNFDSSRPDSTDGGSGTDIANKEEDMRKAARQAIHEGEIIHSLDRTVMTVIRGEFLEMERRGEYKRQRKYLVCSDLSPQATYAMEWTVGTVLREGDILWIAQALGKDDEPHEEKDREQNCRTLAEETKRLLKRTRLQVKVVIEIVAAKVPKHMITEMIDYISPTMVVLGSRGRSAVKNILLGSFSTYLVAKSSCPVMVARKKLKKSRKKGVSAHSLSNAQGGLTSLSSVEAARMANNLNLLANAIVDEKDLQRR